MTPVIKVISAKVNVTSYKPCTNYTYTNTYVLHIIHNKNRQILLLQNCTLCEASFALSTFQKLCDRMCTMFVNITFSLMISK